MTPISEIIVLLENAIDCNTMDKNHSGYTAKEIHRKCLKLFQSIQQDTKEKHNKIPYNYQGWGNTKGE
jgi:hypothetical protein